MSSAVDLPRAGALGRASDAQLTSLIRGGNQDAFVALYERHRSLVDAVARGSSRERAEDIAQEAWTSAYRALSAPGDAIDHVAPWLTTITRNVARDRHRRDMRHPEIASDDIVAAAPAAGGVESALEGKQRIGRLLGAIDELSEEQRRILHLREFGGMTYKQIAAELDKPESTIEAALFRARRKMAKEYEELDSGRRCRIVQSQLLTGRALSGVERMRLTRHLARCASCERVARLEGAEHLIPAPRLARIAGTIPLPAVLARLLSGAGDAAGPLAGKAAVAAAVVVAGTGALVVSSGHDGGDPVRPADPAPAAAAPAPTAATPVSLAAAPVIVRAHRVQAPNAARGGAPAAVVATPLAAVAPASAGPAAPVSAPAPQQRTSSAPVTRRRQASSTQPPAAATPAPAPVAAPAPAPVAPAPQPVASTPPAQAPATAPAAPATPPATGGGPRVTQTPTCLVADCAIGG